MRRVADAVGITPKTIHRHFPNRAARLKRRIGDSFNELPHHWSARGQVADALHCGDWLYALKT